MTATATITESYSAASLDFESDSAQMPLPNRAVLDRSPFIHPLLELLDEGRPVGAELVRAIYDPRIVYRGSVADDGTPSADDERPPTHAGRPELRLTERMVERALQTGACVTPVEGVGGSGSRARGTRAGMVEMSDERRRRRSTSPRTRRLGLIDYTLLALIALGVAITIAMAIVNP